MKAEEIRADHITVKWQKPDDTGGSEITGYIIEKMDLDTGRWVPAGEVCALAAFKNVRYIGQIGMHNPAPLRVFYTMKIYLFFRI